MATKPTVSVILAAFNAEQYVGPAVASILAQRFGDFELLIVNDGSTDTTRDIVESYVDPRIRIIDNPQNVGLTRSLNRALSVAQGDFIARQDADDLSEPERLGEQVAYLAGHPSVALVGTWVTVIDTGGAPVCQSALPSDDLDLRWAMFFSCPFVHSAVMWRFGWVRDHIGGYDERLSYSQDYGLWSRICSRARVANLERFLVRYRDHPASMTATYADKTLEGHRLRLARVSEALGWTGTVEERDARFRAMAALVHTRRVPDLTISEASNAVDDILALHSTMCRQNGVPNRMARRHARAVRRRVSRSLVRASRQHTMQARMFEARRLLSRAYRLYWPAVADGNAARATARLIWRPLRQPR